MRPVDSPSGGADQEVVRPPEMIAGHAQHRGQGRGNDSGQHHCADHAYFHPDCAVCKRACANFQPYPVRRTAPVTRSFGFKDDLTAEKMRELNPKVSDLYAGDTEFNLSLIFLRVLRRLIWPF